MKKKIPKKETTKTRVAERLKNIETQLAEAAKIPQLLGEASKGLRVFQRESREYLRGVLQIGGMATIVLLNSPRDRHRFLKELSVKKDLDDQSYSGMLPVVLGMMFTAKEKPDKTKVNRYARALLELDERGVPVHAIAENIKAAGGIDKLASERAAKRRGKTKANQSGVTISFGAKRFRITLEDLAAVVEPNNGKGRLSVRYKMSKSGEPVPVGIPKIKADRRVPHRGT